MAFQFLCPQRHLLEAEPSQMGQECQCPICGTRMLIPVVGSGPAGPAYPGTGGPPGSVVGWSPGGFEPARPPLVEPQPGPAGGAPGPAYGPPPIPGPAFTGPNTSAAPNTPGSAPAVVPSGPTQSSRDGSSPEAEGAAASAEAEPEGGAAGEVVRIPCPNGHELQTPIDMIGMEVLCPECQAQFQLRYEDSLEYKAQQAERASSEDAFSQAALKWAIIAAVVVFLALVVMIILAVR